jgi:hypothetical protein
MGTADHIARDKYGRTISSADWRIASCFADTSSCCPRCVALRTRRRCRASTHQSPLPMAADLARQRSARSDCLRDRPKHSTPRYSTGLPGCANCRRAARCPHPATAGRSAEEGGGLCKWRPRAAGRRTGARGCVTSQRSRPHASDATRPPAVTGQHGSTARGTTMSCTTGAQDLAEGVDG